MCTGVLYLLRQISPAEELAGCNHCTHLSQKSILYCIVTHHLVNQPAIPYDRMYSGHIITLCITMKYTCLHKSSQNQKLAILVWRENGKYSFSMAVLECMISWKYMSYYIIKTPSNWVIYDCCFFSAVSASAPRVHRHSGHQAGSSPHSGANGWTAACVEQ